MPFLASRDPRPLATAPSGLTPDGLFLGNGNQALEVAVYRAAAEPTRPAMRDLFASRAGQRAAPVVVVVEWGADRAAMATRVGDNVIAETSVDRGQAERICDGALATPDRHGALRFLATAVGQLRDAAIPGVRNEGLFALHELLTGVRGRPDWATASTKAAKALALRGRPLVQALGFGVQSLPGPASVLVAKGTKRAVAIFLDRPDEIDAANQHYDNVSPITYALAKADQENLEYVVVAAGPALRVYPVKPGVGTGRRGRTETFVEINLAVVGPADAGYLWLVASADALAAGGTFEDVLARSTEYAVDLGKRLRDRIYSDVIPPLAGALVLAQRLRRPSAARLAETYEMALLVLFRLLFVAYAEDKDLLPLHSNAQYREHSLKRIAQRLLEDEPTDVDYGREPFLWTEVQQLWRAVDRGNPAWGVPVYNGGLFAPTRDEGGSAAAERLATVVVPDAAFAPALRALLIDAAEDGARGPVDFRSLGVREFGTIYEGLLESELSVAEENLAVDKRGAYIPAGPTSAVVVARGAVYLHNASGARKASGSYYTKAFAVDHLLDGALEPALDDHLARLDALSEREAGAQFFDFRVADIAMGSAHFLVAAIDRIERRFSTYLATRDLPDVRDELRRLQDAARAALGEGWPGDPVEDTQLLRRQIARRCVFGVDRNPIAVELARLSIWIHTFVPGLPLSFLNHTLVVGSSLVGVANFEEASDILAGSGDLFSLTAAERLAKAREPLGKLARLADATAAEVRQAKQLYQDARDRIRGEEALLTILTASRIDATLAAAVAQGNVATRLDAQGDVFTDRLVRQAERALDGLGTLHFPIAFPQVFFGDNPGFNVIIGNPPWEEATVEEDAFWARHAPGLRGLTQREQETEKTRLRAERPDLVALYDAEVAAVAALRRVLTSGPFPGMGTGDPDVYKAFCWRFWHLLARRGGRLGVVLPRSAFSAKGTAPFRTELFAGVRTLDLTMLLNTRGWVFDEAEHRYTIGLLVAERGTGDGELLLRGPYPNLERYRHGIARRPGRFRASDVTAWNDTASLPLLPTDASVDVFSKLRAAPRLDLNGGTEWRARPQTELHATNDKGLMDLASATRPRGYWPVFKGESFDLWEPDTGTYYAWGDPDVVCAALDEKRATASRNKRSAFSEFDAKWLRTRSTLPCRHARIAFRDVTRATDTRTLRAALVPPNVLLTNKAPYLLWPRGTAADQAYLLGVLCSIPLDWYARRFVEISLNFFIFNPFPVPRPAATDPLRQRVVALAGRLAAPDRRFAAWAAGVGVVCGPIDVDEKTDMIHELDAAVARLYGLTEPQLTHVFETFHAGWDYSARLESTLKHFRRLAPR